ncbi:MAG: hypothetical protein EOP34_04100 [Rickettsiales bacterium]|nr:MAG: hypothetical protein EOP34_04100 [Rickettsiales bacterium]
MSIKKHMFMVYFLSFICVYCNAYVNHRVLGVSTHPGADIACSECRQGGYQFIKIPEPYNCEDLDIVMREMGYSDGCLATTKTDDNSDSSLDFSNSEEAKNYAREQQKIAKDAKSARNRAYIILSITSAIFILILIAGYMLFKHKEKTYAIHYTEQLKDKYQRRY